MSSNVLPLRLKQTFLPIIGIFTEGEGDEIKSRLPFKIFFTLPTWHSNGLAQEVHTVRQGSLELF